MRQAPSPPRGRGKRRVLRKAVCGRGKLPAGGFCGRCRERGLPGPIWRQPVRARVAWRCGCPRGRRVGLRGVSESCAGHAGWGEDPREAVQGLLQPPVSQFTVLPCKHTPRSANQRAAAPSPAHPPPPSPASAWQGCACLAPAAGQRPLPSTPWAGPSQDPAQKFPPSS